jgi:hypothetical protein
MVICFALLFMNGHMISAKDKQISGVDDNGNAWNYDAVTKTLTFSGTRDLEENILDGHNADPDWYCWDEDAEHLVIEEGITGLTGGEFSDFTKLKTVLLPNSVTYIGDSVFDSCFQLKSIQMSNNITKIGNSAFYSCNLLKSIEIPQMVSTIGSNSFYDCDNLTEIIIPDSVRKIGSCAFGECDSLRSIRLSNNLTVINEYLFYGCKKLTTMTLPDSIKTIKIGAFQESGIRKIVIPKNVTSFYQIKGEYGSVGVFENCKNLKTIEIKSKKIESCYKGTFSGLDKKVVIKVPECKLKTYKTMFYKSGLSKKVNIKGV